MNRIKRIYKSVSEYLRSNIYKLLGWTVVIVTFKQDYLLILIIIAFTLLLIASDIRFFLNNSEITIEDDSIKDIISTLLKTTDKPTKCTIYENEKDCPDSGTEFCKTKCNKRK